MDRMRTYNSFYVPTIVIEGDARHIIRHRNGPTLCEATGEGTQEAPRGWGRSELCPRCVQVYMREILGKAAW